jgi:(2S)-methylsuccinyl-CoA dehydrogenase
VLVAELQDAVAERVRPDGRLDRAALDAEQHAAHGLAWAAAYAETLRQTAAWAERLIADERFGEAEALPAQLLAHEYLSQLVGGLPMNQGEMFRAAELGVSTHRLEDLIAAPGAGRVAGREAPDRGAAGSCAGAALARGQRPRRDPGRRA